MVINVPDPQPSYQFDDYTFQTTESFKYLGLHIDTIADPAHMIHHVLQRSRAAFAALCEYIGTEGWTTLWTNLVLLDTLVRSNILYGAPVWSPKSLIGNWGTTSPVLRPLDNFYKHCLRTIIGQPRAEAGVRNAVLYVTTNRYPITVLIAKAAWRYFKRVDDMLT